jgi:hypothetical protein
MFFGFLGIVVVGAFSAVDENQLDDFKNYM